MLKYLIIPLAQNSVSFCHYHSIDTSEWISENILSRAIVWAMKENVSVQFVHPTNEIPISIANIVDSIDHATIVPFNSYAKELLKRADIIVFDRLSSLLNHTLRSKQSYIVKSSLPKLVESYDIIAQTLPRVNRLNIVIEDISEIKSIGIDKYKIYLERLIPIIIEEYKNGHQVQFNLLTDRLFLNKMNNCNAGEESITLAPNGKFYICPAFYMEGNDNAVGDLDSGINILNSQLYKLTHAPICSICDAYQCKRCVWLNKILTREVNTPSQEQCVVAHIERNSSKKLLEEFRNINSSFLTDADIPGIDYLDPFYKLINKQI